METEQERDDGLPRAAVADEGDDTASRENDGERVKRKDVAHADVEAAGDGCCEIDGEGNGEKQDFARTAEFAERDRGEGKYQKDQFGEGAFDQQGDGKVITDNVCIDMAEKIAGPGIAKIANVGQAVEVGFGQKVRVGEAHENPALNGTNL